jgi:hypothetical protein
MQVAVHDAAVLNRRVPIGGELGPTPLDEFRIPQQRP